MKVYEGGGGGGGGGVYPLPSMRYSSYNAASNLEGSVVRIFVPGENLLLYDVIVANSFCSWNMKALHSLVFR